MSVLVEAFSIIVRRSTIADKYPGGLAGYMHDCPNQTFCTDTDLTRVGFMVPSDVQTYVGRLQMQGLSFIRDGSCDEIVVVDQSEGPTVPCNWIEFARPGEAFSYCWLKGTMPGALAAPNSWSRGQVHKVPGSQDALAARGHSRGLDVFRDEKTGTPPLYVARAFAADAPQLTSELVAQAR